jgi:SAM-dependent methyltransferase
VTRYYEAKIRAFGPTARGVDWPSEESQQRRFAQLLTILDGAAIAEPVHVADIGCGYGALIDFLRRRGRPFHYVGYDAASDMLAVATRRFGGRDEHIRFVSEWDDLPEVDVAVASGVFNVRLGHEDDVWWRHIVDMLEAIHTRVRHGWAANFLTIHSDADRMRSDLYYADPARLVDWCTRRLTRHVAVLHDYGLYDFALIARKLPRLRG